MQSWQQAQEFEFNWWGDCLDTIGEEIKQKTYHKKLGLIDYDLKGKSVIDVGGGPVSLLLKFKNRGFCTVVDPLNVPSWVKIRYEENHIQFKNKKAEDYKDTYIYDEAWIYNCLQHTENPQKIIKNVLSNARVIRMFEWINTPISDGHIHTLKEDLLNKWLGGEGKVETINENGCIGTCFYGVFKGHE